MQVKTEHATAERGVKVGVWRVWTMTLVCSGPRLVSKASVHLMRDMDMDYE